MNDHYDFATSHRGLRFTDPINELQYRAWRLEKDLPIGRQAIIVALLSWIVGPSINYLIAPDYFFRILPYLIGMIVLFSISAVLVYIPRIKGWLYLFFNTLTIACGCSLPWVTLEYGHSPGGAVVWCVFVLMFTLLARFPPRFILWSAGLPTVLILWLMSHSYIQDKINAVDAFVYLTAPVLAFFLQIGVSVLIERNLRIEFIGVQIIRLQRELIDRRAKLIRRYLPPAVADRIESGNEGTIDMPQRRRITVLFSDVVGFTEMADILDPESLTEVLNDYMANMANIVERHNGTVSEFIGDGLLAIFGAPDEIPPKDQAINAIRAAQDMHTALPKLNDRWFKLGITEPLSIRIGINTGVLSVGSFGSGGRMTYTAIGLQANIAARIQAMCKAGCILISGSTWHLVKEEIKCEPQGNVEVKGVHFPVSIYSPS